MGTTCVKQLWTVSPSLDENARKGAQGVVPPFPFSPPVPSPRDYLRAPGGDLVHRLVHGPKTAFSTERRRKRGLTHEDIATLRGGFRRPLTRHTTWRRVHLRATLRGRLTRECPRRRHRFSTSLTCFRRRDGSEQRSLKRQPDAPLPQERGLARHGCAFERGLRA